MKENERPDLQKFKKVILSICYGKANKMLKGTRNFFLVFSQFIIISETNERGRVEKKTINWKVLNKSSSNSKSKKVKNFYGYRAVARSFISPLLFHSEARLIREIKIKSRLIHVLFHCVSACFSLSLVSFRFVDAFISILIEIRLFYWKGYSFCLAKHFSLFAPSVSVAMYLSALCQLFNSIEP